MKLKPMSSSGATFQLYFKFYLNSFHLKHRITFFNCGMYANVVPILTSSQFRKTKFPSKTKNTLLMLQKK